MHGKIESTPSEYHHRLAVHLGGKFARLIEGRLEEIGTAVAGEQRQASFSVTAEFKPRRNSDNPDGDLYRLSMKPRLRTPDEAIVIDLKMVDGQLSLYEKDERTDAVKSEHAEDAPDPDGAPATH
jgi:hypothetical protein